MITSSIHLKHMDRIKMYQLIDKALNNKNTCGYLSNAIDIFEKLGWIEESHIVRLIANLYNLNELEKIHFIVGHFKYNHKKIIC